MALAAVVEAAMVAVVALVETGRLVPIGMRTGGVKGKCTEKTKGYLYAFIKYSRGYTSVEV